MEESYHDPKPCQGTDTVAHITPLDRWSDKCYYARDRVIYQFMSGITSIALMGLFAWSGTAVGTTTWNPQVPPPTPLMVQELTGPLTGPTLSVRLTGYNAVPEQTDSNPEITASGARSNPEISAARSRDLASELPFGTIIAFETAEKSNSCGFGVVDHLIGYRVIMDTMHERMANKIDIMFDTEDMVHIGVNGEARRPTNAARALGICDVTIRVVGKVNMSDIPNSQTELALLVNKAFALR